MMGDIVRKIDMEAVLRGIGVTEIKILDPLDLDIAISQVKQIAEKPGVKAIIFRSPCIALTKSEGSMDIEQDRCVQCKKCIRELGCPALLLKDSKVCVDSSLCTGCGLCSQICPTHAIQKNADGSENTTRGFGGEKE